MVGEMANAVRHKQTRLPKQPGEMARLKVVQGPDKGVVFVVTGARVTIGRGDENDVMFMDLKSSRKHAEMALDASGLWSVRDLGSANGIVHNGSVTRAAQLKKGDTIAIGETVFEFTPGDAGTRTLMAPPKPVSADYAFPAVVPDPKKKIAPVRTAPAPTAVAAAQPAAAPGAFAGIAGIGAAMGGTSGTQNKRPLLILLIGVAAWFYLDEEPPPPKPAVKKEEGNQVRDLASYLPAYDPSARLNSAEMFFRAGFREYRERNYLRAKTQFETTLQIAPGHRLATLYLKHCEKAIEDEVRHHIEQGRKGLDIGKLTAAKGHFEAVTRLLHRDPESAAYREAQDQLAKIEEVFKGGSGG